MMIAILLNLILVGALVLALSKAGSILGPRPVHRGDADLPFETGMRPIAPAALHMTVLYYRFAVLFVVFDVEAAFLLPLAVGRSGLDAQKMLAVSAFVVLLAFMLIYFWRRGILECGGENAS